MAYATINDLLLYGLPQTALGQLTNAQQLAALDNASAVVDSYLRGRYVLPITNWGIEIIEATVKIAAYNLLQVRGYNPASGADINIRNRYDDAIMFLNKVQRQAAHPNITDSSVGNGQYSAPIVNSVSTISSNSSTTSKNRGW